MRLALALVLCAGAAGAEGPPPEYFAGVFERVGRSGDVPPVLLNDLVRIAPEGQEGLRVMPCAGDDPPLILTFDRFGEVSNLLSTPEGQDWLGCQFFNDMDNYPILNCHGGDGSLVTFWPSNEPGRCDAP